MSLAPEPACARSYAPFLLPQVPQARFGFDNLAGSCDAFDSWIASGVEILTDELAWVLFSATELV